jgi:hypothetical protein
MTIVSLTIQQLSDDCGQGQEDMMKSLLAMILAMTVSMPVGSWAQQDQAALRRVHLMTGTGTIPRNPPTGSNISATPPLANRG